MHVDGERQTGIGLNLSDVIEQLKGQPVKVYNEPRPDKNDDRSWVADFEYLNGAKRPVTLREIKESHKFDDWALVRQGRLSTMPTPEEFWKWLQEQGAF